MSLILSILLLSTSECQPPCRKGYLCIDGQCVSECNPPCAENYLCKNGDCEPDPNARPTVVAPAEPEPKKRGRRMSDSQETEESDYQPNQRYFGLGGGGWFLLNHRSDAGTKDIGELDIEFGSRFFGQAFQLAFPEETFVLGLAMRVQFPIPLKDRLFLEPQFGLVFNSYFADSGREFQLGIGPGLRLRYDVFSMLAFYLQVFRLDIMVLSYVQPDTGDAQRLEETFVFLNAGGGFEVRY